MNINHGKSLKNICTALSVSLFLLLFSINAFATKITKVRAWTSPDKTRLVFEIDNKISYKVFSLSGPERLITDIKGAQVGSTVLNSLLKSDLITKVRKSTQVDKQKRSKLRMVFELKRTVKVHHFILPPNKTYRYRLVIDLFNASSSVQKSKSNLKSKTNQSSSKYNSTRKTSDAKSGRIRYKDKNIQRDKKTAHGSSDNLIIKPKAKVSFAKKKIVYNKSRQSNSIQRKLIIAIDAGHGGEDPGAIGGSGIKEKHIVLGISKRLAKIVNRTKGMKAVLVRQGDYYVSLSTRTKIARKAKADIFISIHADAFRNSKASGSSVFILSKRGASSEFAKWLATKENSSDLAGGVSLDDKDDLLVKVLLDLSQTATIEGSVSAASRILKGLKKIGKVHKKQVERAGFVVLKSPDIPSVLVETGFISNPYEESKLSKPSYQQKVASAIFNGVNDYFKRYPIPGTVYGQNLQVYDDGQIVTSKNSSRVKSITPKKTSKYKTRFHVVRRGDSLSKISVKYNVAIKTLKRINRLRSDKLYVGKKLRLFL